MTTTHPVLNRPVPATGRAMTVMERKALSVLGIQTPSRAWLVQDSCSNAYASVYRPTSGGISAVGIRVTTRA
jgi:hypothetical protein